MGIFRPALSYHLATAALLAYPGLCTAINPQADPGALIVSGEARFTVLTSALIRMEHAPGAKFEDRATYAFINRRLPVPRYSIIRNGGWIDIRTSELQLRYKENSGPFTSENLSVIVKHAGLDPNSASVTWRPGTPDRGNLLGTVRTLDSVNGARPLEPGILSLEGWAVVDDTTRTLLTTDVHTTGAPLSDWPWAAERTTTSTQDLYFFGYGRDYKRALQDFTQVSGKIPMPPKWAFGAWWSRYWAYTDQELKDLVGEFRAHGVPLDVLVIDMDWHLKGWTGYTWNPKYFPDPEGFLKWAHDEGLHVTLNLHPADGVGPHEAAYPEFARTMGIDSTTTAAIPFDITNSRFVDAYFRLLHHPLEKQGIDFWWLDWQQGTNTKLTNIDPLHWLNYLHWTDVERNPARAGQRPLLFSRWGGLGNHRYQTGFSGDTYNDWPSLAFQPYFTATAGNVGYAYWSHDIGGHIPGPVAPDLYTRWMQWAAVNPILRTHGGNSPTTERRIWAFDGETYEMLKQAWYLRYSLIPYIYTAARQCYDTGMPLLRPLYYHWPEMDEAYTHGGQYMFGNDLLVHPVVEPADPISSCTLQKTWLPPGVWIDWFTDKVTTGPTEIENLVSMDRIPMWARAGAIIPTATVKRGNVSHWESQNDEDGFRTCKVPESEGIRSTADQPNSHVCLDVFPGWSGEAILYQDDGVTTGYQAAEMGYTILRKSVSSDGTSTTITVEPVSGSYPGMPETRSFELRLRSVGDMTSIRQVLVNGKELVTTGIRTSGMQRTGALCYGDCIVWGLPSFRSEDRVEFVFEHPDSNRAQELAARGTRHLLHLANQIAQLVAQLPPGSVSNIQAPQAGNASTSPGSVYWLTMPQSAPATVPKASGAQVLQGCCSNDGQTSATWTTLAQHVLKCALAIPDSAWAKRTGFLLQLLGITTRIEVKTNAAGEIEVTIIMRRLNAAAPLHFSAGITLSRPWSPQPEPKPHTIPPGEKEGRVTWKIPAPTAPAQTQIRATLDMELGGLHLAIPLSSLFTPSIGDWYVVGPFDNPDGVALNKTFPPEEQAFTPNSMYAGKNGVVGWQHITRKFEPGDDLSREFVVDLHKVFGGRTEKAAAYAYTNIKSDRDTKATLYIGADDGVAVWLNGKRVWRNPKGRPYRSREDKIEVELKKGDNPLLLKISQGTNDWAFSVQVETPSTDDDWMSRYLEHQIKQPSPAAPGTPGPARMMQAIGGEGPG